MAADSEVAIVKNGSVAEPSVKNAGVRACNVAAARNVGVLRAAGVSPVAAMGFGSWGGLLAWLGPRELRARLVSSSGALAGESFGLRLPADAVPQQVIPVDGGFVVLAVRAIERQGMCRATCRDATCSGWRGTNAPRVCTFPCSKPCQVLDRREAHLMYLRADASFDMVQSNPKSLSLGRHVVVATSPPHQRAFAFVTSSAQLIHVEVTARGDRTAAGSELELSSRAFDPAEIVLPVRGAGEPTFLFADESGHQLRLVDRHGQHPISSEGFAEGGFSTMDARLQARWGSDERIHLAWSTWHGAPGNYQMATIGRDQRVALDGPPRPATQLGAPFVDYLAIEPLEVASARVVVARSSWLSGRVGEPIELFAAAAEDDVAAGGLNYTFSGTHFVFAHAIERRGGAEELLRVTIVDCAPR